MPIPLRSEIWVDTEFVGGLTLSTHAREGLCGFQRSLHYGQRCMNVKKINDLSPFNVPHFCRKGPKKNCAVQVHLQAIPIWLS